MTASEIIAMNPDLGGKTSGLEGKTIVLPGDKLSVRDKEILDGMAKGKGKGYRIYPVGWVRSKGLRVWACSGQRT